MRLIDRFVQYLESKKIKRAKAEKQLGLSNGYIRNQENRAGTVGSDTLEKIAQTYLDLSLTWLITGKGQMLLQTNEPPTIESRITDLEQRLSSLEEKAKKAGL